MAPANNPKQMTARIWWVRVREEGLSVMNGLDDANQWLLGPVKKYLGQHRAQIWVGFGRND